MHSNSQQHAVIILAAGASRRLGTPKQLLMIDNETLLNRTLRIAASTHPAQTLLVLGYNADEIYASIDHQINNQNIERIDCSDWHTGMSASLRAGIQHVSPHCAGALVVLCDQTHLTTQHLNALHVAWSQQPHCVAASSYGGSIGVPALFPRHWFVQINALKGDQGARELLRDDATVISIDAPELVHDVDLPQDLPSYFA